LRATPASANALYNVGYHAIRVNRPQEALAAITRADPERPPLRQAPSYWSILTVARHQLGDHAAELRDARRARVLHPDRQQSIRAECRALAALGRTDSLRRPLAASMELRLRAIDTPAGEVMRDAAAELRAHGHEAAARDVFARALAWYDARPAPERATAARRRWRGMVLYDMGRWDDARAAFERLAAEQPRDPEPRGYLGALAARRGDRAAALAADRTLAALREPYLFGRHTYWRARIAALLGERERGVALLRDALQQGRTYLEVHSEADFAPLRAVPAFQELVRPKD
jgi:tetratricopeptide (TPR) repeat protein